MAWVDGRRHGLRRGLGCSDQASIGHGGCIVHLVPPWLNNVLIVLLLLLICLLAVRVRVSSNDMVLQCLATDSNNFDTLYRAQLYWPIV